MNDTCTIPEGTPANEIVKTLIGKIAEIEHVRGIVIDWMAELWPLEGHEYTTREVVNAMGRALTKAGIPNNLEKP